MSLIDDAIGLVNKWRDAATGIRPSGTWTGYDLADRYDWCADELDALMPAIRQAMIDAERYRWLRDSQQTATTSDWLGVYPADSRQCYYGPRLDAAIDKARATGEGEGNG